MNPADISRDAHEIDWRPVPASAQAWRPFGDYFLVAVNVPLPKLPYSTLPFMLVGLSTVPAYRTPPTNRALKENSTWSPFTVPERGALPNSPEYVPLSFSPSCLNV